MFYEQAVFAFNIVLFISTCILEVALQITVSMQLMQSIFDKRIMAKTT